MELAIQKVAIVLFLAIGLSHIVQPRAWARFFMRLHDLGDLGNFLNAMMSLITGALIVGFHNVWNGIPVVLTVLGWLFVIKGALFLLVPGLGRKSIEQVTEAKARMFIVPGVVLAAVAVLLLTDQFLSN